MKTTAHCTECQQLINPPRDDHGNLRLCCSDECRAKRRRRGRLKANASRRDGKLKKLQRLEEARVARGEPPPQCVICSSVISPSYTIDGTLRRVCDEPKCGTLIRVRRRYEGRRSLNPGRRMNVVENDVGRLPHNDTRRPKRVCDTCCDLPHRRSPIRGCPECNLPFQEERVVSVKGGMSAIALAARWA